MMSAIDLLVILAVSTVVLATSLVFSRFGRNLRSYVNGGGHTPWLFAGISMFMSFFSAGTFIVWGSISYSLGIVGITLQETIFLAGLLTSFFIAGRWKKTGADTVAEYIRGRYGSRVGNSFTAMFIILSIFSAGAFLYPVALILSQITSMSLELSAVVISMLCMVSVSLGGFKSVIATDFLKFLILGIAILVLVPLSLKAACGMDGIKAIGQEGYLSPVTGEYTWVFMAAFCIYNTVNMGGNWSIVQKLNSVSSEKNSRRAGITFSILYFICPILWMLPCLACRAIDGAQAGFASEDAFIRITQDILPQGLTGLMFIALIMTSMSSINAMIHSSASVVANDLMKSHFPDASERKCLATGKVAAFLMGAAAVAIVCITHRTGGIVNFVISLAALAGAPVYLPVIWSLFSRSITGKEMLVASLTSILLNISGKYLLPSVIGISYDKTMEMAVGVGAPILILISAEIIHHIINNNQLTSDLC